MNVVFGAWSQSALNLRHQSIAKYRGDIGTRGEASRVPEICTHHTYSNLKYTRFLDYFANLKYVNLLLACKVIINPDFHQKDDVDWVLLDILHK